jgi:signal transduction histidine kinase
MNTPVGPTKQRLRTLLDWIGQPGGAPIEAWRRRILAAVLLGCCVFGGLAYAVGGSIAWASGQRGVVVFDTIIYTGLLIITLRRSLPYAVRAGVVTMLPLLLGVYFLWNFGFMAAGFPWLLAFPVIASVLFGVNTSIRALAVTAIVLVGLGLMIPTGRLSWTADLPAPGLMWAVSASSVFAIDLLLSLSVGYLFEGLGYEVVARRAAELESDRRQRLAALGTITGGIAHDFNNLLQPIVADAEHAQRVVAEGGDPRPLLGDILQTSERARMLVRRILSFAKPPQGVRDVLEMGALVAESERLLPALLPANVTLSVQVETPVHVAAEASELQQVLLNLVSNAAQAMPNGGVVQLRVDEAAPDRLAGTPLDGMPRIARLTVTDTGVGMDRATLARIFEPFYTTKGPQRGSGLGLSTVHATVTALRGVVRVHSAPGRGTRMEVLLPALPAPDIRAPHGVVSGLSDLGNAGNPESAAPRLVFVVDDEPAVLRGTARLLERAGFEVRAFGSPTEVEPALVTARPVLVLTDLAMPDLDGWQVAATVDRMAPGVPVIVMTGHMDTHEEDLLQHAGVSALLPKPFTSAELDQLVRQLLR